MRRHSAGLKAAVAGAAVLASLVFVATAGAVTITSFSPHSGLPAKDNGEACPGGTIQINGTGFYNDGGIGGKAIVAGTPTQAVTVTFGGVPSTYVVVGSDTVMYAVVPDGAKDGPLVVTTGAGSFSTLNAPDPNGTTFYVNPCPQVSLKVATANAAAAQGADTSTPSIYKMAPAKGKAGTTVTLTGTNLLGVTGVLFGQTKAKFTIVSPTQITTTVPSGAKTGRIVLQYTIGASVSQAGNGLTSGTTAQTPSNTPTNSGAKVAYQYSKTNFTVG